MVLLSLMAHYGDVIMDTIGSQIISLPIVYSTVYSDADQRKYQSSASLAFVWGIHRGPVNSQHKWPVTRKMFPFDDVMMNVIIFWHSALAVLYSKSVCGVKRCIACTEDVRAWRKVRLLLPSSAYCTEHDVYDAHNPYAVLSLYFFI